MTYDDIPEVLPCGCWASQPDHYCGPSDVNDPPDRDEDEGE